MEGNNSTESLEIDVDVETDILDFENAPDYIEGDYRQLLRIYLPPFAPVMNNGYPWYNRPPVNWKIIVELNHLLSKKNGVYCWWYDTFF